MYPMSDVVVPVPATEGKHGRLLNARTHEGKAREGIHYIDYHVEM